MKDRAAAEADVTKLQVATAAADAFLTIIAAQQTVVAARAGVERARVLNEVIATLAKNELRPGADASRSRAELALAQTQQIQAEQAVAVARAALAQLLGTKPETILIEPGPLLQTLAAPQVLDVATTQHPLAIAREAAVSEVKARERALDRLYFPRLYFQGQCLRGERAFSRTAALAGNPIVQGLCRKCSRSSRETYPERSAGRLPLCEERGAGKGQHVLSPPQRTAAPASVISAAQCPAFLRMESPRISMRCAL
jgi:outer membrane protein TolC